MNLKRILPYIIGGVLAFISVFVIFKPEFDLHVYTEIIDIMHSLNTDELLIYILGRGEWLSLPYLYIMGKIGLTGFIQVIPTFFFYYIITYIVFDYIEYKKYDKKYGVLILILIFSLYKYQIVVAGIRFSLAMSILLLAEYLRNVKRRDLKKIGFLYILPGLIHMAFLPFVLFRLICGIKNNKVYFSILALGVGLIAFPQIIISVLNFTNIDLLASIALKIEGYLVGDKSYVSIQYIFRIMQFIAICVFVVYGMLRKYYSFKDNKFLIALFVLGVCLINKYWIFHRFIDFTLLFSIFAMLDLLSKEKNKYVKTIILLGIMLMIIVGIRIQIPTIPLMFVKS